ncbi:MAG: hypothetical protein JW888_06940 [Pirellulales bacterium]|nr:hypothetical protein [Pirellulales bacterium]
MTHRLKKTALLAALAVFLTFPTFATAQQKAGSSSDDALANRKFAICVNVAAFRETPLGAKLFEVFRQKAVAQIERHHKSQDAPEKIKKVLGFDPFEEIKGITVIGSDYDDPEKDLKVVVHMGKTTGNLEGLLLARPDYESSTYGDYVIHTAAPTSFFGKSGPHRSYGAVRTDSSGIKTVALAVSREGVIELLDAIEQDTLFDRLGLPEAHKALLSVYLEERPKDKTEIERKLPAASNAAKLIQRVAFMIYDREGDFQCKMVLTAKQDQQAEQLRQMAEGLAAMAALAEPARGEEEKVKAAQKLLEGLKVTRNGSEVTLELKVPGEAVVRLLKDEASLSM